ncbi:ZnMc domain-containing protein [Mycena indigotica]|uniref:ZnMc domain-containing protein n=1 Tax=Mycena indigotica TaxID=2126181 RepID=A0A8H6W2M0_9AGAR|nr:ZnMc domain-containing protein [Mycena indigotica]KAF7299403.1 ZnMc domain-containing protein [Mycena indigotica]
MSTDKIGLQACTIAVSETQQKDGIVDELVIGALGNGPSGSRRDAVSTRLDYLWDSGATITFSFSDGTPNRQGKVEKILLEWTPYANITFQREETGTIRISFNPAQGSWSYVGKANNEIDSPKPTMNIGWLDDTPEITDSDRGLVLHLFGHCLGLFHEHQSPAQGGSVKLKEEEVYAFSQATQGWSKDTTKANILDVYNNTSLSNYSEVDSTSIMKYPIPSQLAAEGVDVKMNYELSLQDKAFMIINYPRPKPHESALEWTLEYALKVSSVDQETTQSILDAHKTGEIIAVRALFNAFQLTARINKTTSKPGPVPNGASNGTLPRKSNQHPPDSPLEQPTDEWCLTFDDQIDAGATGDGLREISARQRLWLPHQQIKFGFFDISERGCEATEFRKIRVRNALKLYMEHTSLVFVEVEGDEFRSLDFSKASDRAKCPLRIAFGNLEKVDGKVRYGWSQNGKKITTFEFAGPGNAYGAPGPKYATLWLGGQPLTESTNLPVPESDRATASIYHELGHVLGLLHVADPPSSQLKNSQNVVSSLLSFLVDTKSVMFYPSKDPTKLELNTSPSPTDLDVLRLLYPDNGRSDGKFAAALNAFSFYPEDRNTLLGLADRVIGQDNKIDEELNVILWSNIATAFNKNDRRGQLSTSPPVGHNLADKTGPLIDPAFEPANAWCASSICDDAVAKGSASRPDGFIEAQDQLWQPYERITYGFLPWKASPSKPNQSERDCAPTPYRKQFVKDVISQYMKHASIVLEEVPDDFMTLADFSKEQDRQRVDIRIAFGPPVRKSPEALVWGWSYTGAHARKFDGFPKPGAPAYATTFLGGLPQHSAHEVSEKHLTEMTRAVYHEVGHVFGLSHEHDSSTSSIVGAGNTISRILVATMLDPDSIMLHRNKPYPKLSQPKYNQKPSNTDLALLRLMYPDNGDARGAFARALRQMQFSPPDAETLLTKVALAVATPSEVNTTEIKRIRSGIALDINLAPRLAQPPPPLTGPHRDSDLRGLRNDDGETHRLDADEAKDDGSSNGQAAGFLYELVQTLKQFFNPGGNQQFVLQFPGRFLDQNSYAWDTSEAGINGQFVKPIVVNESEFRLVDQLYDLQDTVGGPNGTNLSIVYEQLLNNLLPKFVPNGLGAQQAEIRDWLTKEVPSSQWIKDIQARHRERLRDEANALALSLGTKTAEQIAEENKNRKDEPPDTKNTINRIELSQLLMNEYLYAKQDWQIERDALIKQANASDLGTNESKKALNELTRKLAHITASRQSLLAEKYNDAVVRGHLHTIKEYLGYLDIASPAAALQSAKDSLREASMSSLDGSMKVYPVQLSPLDWFEGLSTSFTMEDLTQDPEVIRQQIKAKSQQLDVLNSQLVTLQMGSKGDPAELEKQVEDLRTELDSAQTDLAKAYSSNVIETAKTFLTVEGNVDKAGFKTVFAWADATIDKLDGMLSKVQDAQARLNATSRAFTMALAARALAIATDTKEQQRQISLQIQSLTEDLKELQLRWQTLTAKTGGTKPPDPPNTDEAELPKTPVMLPGEASSGGSRWQTIAFTSSSESRQKWSSSNSSASSKSWSCNLWFASASSSSSSESASSASETKASKDTIELAFRATLVTVDRGGWFQPQFFKQSNAFYKVNKGISWVDNAKEKVTGLMPGFPVAYILAKDIVIRITHDKSASKDSKTHDASNSASSGGILCFSYSQSNSSTNDSSSSNFQAYSNGFVVKIPGPQILGYIMEKVAPDEGELMPSKLPEDFFIPDKQFEEKKLNQEHKLKSLAAGLEQPNEEPLLTREHLKEVLDTMMEDNIEELYEKLRKPETKAST